jgi:hypothetical protein
MSRTYRKIGYTYRCPKGHKNAVINGARKRSIPPTSWDDYPSGKDCFLPYRAARNMVERGFDSQKVIKKLSKKFHLSFYEAFDIVKYSVEHQEQSYLMDIRRREECDWKIELKCDYKTKIVKETFHDFWDGKTTQDLKKDLSYWKDYGKKKSWIACISSNGFEWNILAKWKLIYLLLDNYLSERIRKNSPEIIK